jgi:hypothetical protein
LSTRLKISQWVTPGIQDVILYVHPKSDKKVKNYRRAHCKKRNINKIFSDGRRRHPHSFPNSAANTKYMPLDKIPKPVHYANIKINLLKPKFVLNKALY